MIETAIRQLQLEDFHTESGAVWGEQRGWNLPRHYGVPEQEYAEIMNGSGIIDRSDREIIRVSGETAQDFLHRMTSAPIEELEPGIGMETVVTTAEGRFVDWVTVYHTGEEYLTMVTSPGAREEIIEHLTGYIFFKDDVQFDRVDEQWILLQISGPKAAAAAQEVFGADMTEAERYRLRELPAGSDTGYLVKVHDVGREDCQVFWPVSEQEMLRERLADLGENGIMVGRDAYEIARIQSGLPAYPNEINNRYLMLEAHLETPMDLTSCFAGQEVIARTLNFGKIKQHLCHLKFSEELPGELDLPVRIYSGERRVGRLTSVAAHPADNTLVGLGYIKTKYAEPGTPLQIREEGYELSGELGRKTEAR